MIPTIMLIIVLCYWIIASLGFFDLEFLDMDLDLDMEGAEGTGLLNAIAAFINFGELPVTLVLSCISLNFWIISMLMYYLPIKAGGLVNGILLLPVLIVSMYITRLEVLPFKDKYLKKETFDDIEHKVLDKKCELKCDLNNGRLGQAEIRQDGASIVINVRPQFENESFEKGEYAFVFRKDKKKDIYYISKLVMGSEFYKDLEED